MRRHPFIFVMVGQLLIGSLLQAADVSPTNTPTVLPPVNVIGHMKGESLTSPSPEKADEQKQQIPGGFSVKTNTEQGRMSNFQDLLEGTPGVTLQTENGVEVTKISVRGSGIDSDDEPLGVEFLLDGISFQQGDGEVILEDL